MIHSFFLHNFWFLHSAAGNILPLNSMLNNQDMHRYMIHSPATVFLIVRKPPDTSPRAASLNTLLLVLVAYHLLHLGVGQRVQEGGPEVAEGVLQGQHLVVGCGRESWPQLEYSTAVTNSPPSPRSVHSRLEKSSGLLFSSARSHSNWSTCTNMVALFLYTSDKQLTRLMLLMWMLSFMTILWDSCKGSGLQSSCGRM